MESHSPGVWVHCRHFGELPENSRVADATWFAYVEIVDYESIVLLFDICLGVILGFFEYCAEMPFKFGGTVPLGDAVLINPIRLLALVKVS